jgi:hypothetical protein
LLPTSIFCTGVRTAGWPVTFSPRTVPAHGIPGEVEYELWRQDDNGNRVRIRVFESREAAEEAQAELEAKGHKQIYWVQALDTDDSNE